MKKFLQFPLLAFILFLFTCSNSLSQGTVETRSFESPSLGVTKYYKIYLPPGYYQSTEDYSVVYFFRNHENEWFNTSALKAVADELLEAGLIGNMILVGPNSGSNNGFYFGCVNMLRPDLAPAYGIGTGKFEDYIVNDLVTHIDTTFRTIADKQHRGIDGFSMGGFVSTVTSLRNPGVYSSIGSFEGTLMFYNLEDPGVPGSGADDMWMNMTEADPIFNVPRNIPYMLEHSVTNILELADTSTLNQFRSNRYHISHGYKGGATNYWRNKNFIDKLNEKGIRNSWGNPILHDNFIHSYGMANYHATASLIKHWQTFNSTKISAPTLIDFSITESTGKDREVEVFNYGPGSLTITDIQINSGEFSIANLPSLPVTLQPQIETFTFNVNFLPPSNQSFADTAYIYSDDPVTPAVKIILRGKGGSFKADPGMLYAVSPTALYLINTDPVNSSLIGNYGNSINYIRELSVNPTTKELFGLGQFSGTFYDLFIINAKGGDAFPYHYDINCESSIITSAAFINDSLLYLGRVDGNIYSLNINIPYWSAPINLVASTGLPITALALNPVTQELWAAVGSFGNLDRIYKLNVTTGDTIYIGKTGLNKSTQDIVFDYNGILYGLIKGGTDSLITIDTLTGIATKLGSLNTTGLYAIAISPDPPSGIIEPQDISSPEEFYLAQNFPNPFNPTTTIVYGLRERMIVELKVYDVLGREIEAIVNGEQEAGYYEIEFNANRLASGIYFYRLQAGSFIETKKMVLMR
ncbi:alpha/beta hydrolase-fold protein [Bacteroidota bacterium]